MVLFQIPIIGYTTAGKISTVLPCPFYGQYKVRFLNYAIAWNTQPNTLLRVNSQALWGNYAGGQIIVGSNPQQYVVFNTHKYEFESHSLNGFIDIDITLLNGDSPANFMNAYLSFDFEKI